MKLLLCKQCQDVIKLVENQKRTCICGSIGGLYIDSVNAVYFGKLAVPLGFSNSSLVNAVWVQPKTGMGENFTAFVIPKECPTFKLVTASDVEKLNSMQSEKFYCMSSNA